MRILKLINYMKSFYFYVDNNTYVLKGIIVHWGGDKVDGGSLSGPSLPPSHYHWKPPMYNRSILNRINYTLLLLTCFIHAYHIHEDDALVWRIISPFLWRLSQWDFSSIKLPSELACSFPLDLNKNCLE